MFSSFCGLLIFLVIFSDTILTIPIIDLKKAFFPVFIIRVLEHLH